MLNMLQYLNKKPSLAVVNKIMSQIDKVITNRAIKNFKKLS